MDLLGAQTGLHSQIQEFLDKTKLRQHIKSFHKCLAKSTISIKDGLKKIYLGVWTLA